MAASTTIKVTPQARDRINESARAQGVTPAVLLEQLLDENDRARRFAAESADIVVVLPVTTRDRGLPNHVQLGGATGLDAEKSWAMTEQPRTIDRRRITAHAGRVDGSTLRELRSCLHDFLTRDF